MKSFLFYFICCLAISVQSFSQAVNNNLVIYCNDGNRFTLIMDGQRYNETPTTNIRVESLSLHKYSVRINFENTRIKPWNGTITLPSTNIEANFALNQMSKKKYSLDFVSQKEIIPTQHIEENTTITDNTTNNNNNTNTNNTNNSGNQNNGGNQGQSGGVTFSAGHGTGVTISDKGISLNTKDGGVNLNTKTNSGGVTLGSGDNAVTFNKTGKTGCSNPLNYEKFQDVKDKIKSYTVEEERFDAAKIALQSNCFSTGQVKEIMGFFTKEETKLEFAKRAYFHTSDLSNYHQLKESFTKEENKKSFQTFLSENK